MSDYNSLVPMVADAAIVVSGTITNFITKTKAGGVVQHAQLELLKAQTRKVLTEAKIRHAGELVTVTLEELAKTQDQIDSLEKRGLLHGATLVYAMEQLEALNNLLQCNLQKYAQAI